MLDSSQCFKGFITRGLLGNRGSLLFVLSRTVVMLKRKNVSYTIKAEPRNQPLAQSRAAPPYASAASRATSACTLVISGQ